jgi:hypothetical protein
MIRLSGCPSHFCASYSLAIRPCSTRSVWVWQPNLQPCQQFYCCNWHGDGGRIQTCMASVLVHDLCEPTSGFVSAYTHRYKLSCTPFNRMMVLLYLISLIVFGVYQFRHSIMCGLSLLSPSTIYRLPDGDLRITSRLLGICGCGQVNTTYYFKELPSE